jgi:hypothetical protein
LETPATETLGLNETWDFLRESGSRLATALPAEVSEAFLSLTRTWLHTHIATFFGDVMVYLKTRGTPQQPGPIVRTVLDDLNKACASPQFKTAEYKPE